jgi:p-cumate 2,3-dioxygenase alpha subunit
MSLSFMAAPTSRKTLREFIAKAVVDDPEGSRFKVHRKVFIDEAVLQLERDIIFDHCWLYLGHTSEVATPNHFVTRKVVGRPLILTRDGDGQLRAFFNTCAHRGAVVCREPQGRRRTFQCGYHGWVYDDRGHLIDMPGRESMAPASFEGAELNLREVPRLAEYCGFVFVSFDAQIVDLETYLGGAREILDLISNQGGQGMEVIRGSHEYGLAANWKLVQENSADAYHTMTTHASYLDYVNARDGKRTVDPKVAAGWARDLGNGHAVIESEGAMPWGRPYARWVPSWGEDAREEVEAIAREIAGRLGDQRGRFLTDGDRNTLIFPNLVINDTLAVIVRTFFPTRPDYVEVTGWALAPRGESVSSRERRMRNFVEFFGPAGFATPDDVEMLALCQQGYANTPSAEWNDISRGMLKDVPAKNDELQMRTFWRQWHKLMNEFLEKNPA